MTVFKFSQSIVQFSHGARLLRRGNAPLEFVMCLVVLLPLFVAILWLGMSMIGQAEVVIEARHLTWQKRHKGKTSDTFRFEAMRGKQSQSATRSVSISPLFDSASDPSSEHLVLGGSWDHTQITPNDGLNRQANWDLYGRIAEDSLPDLRNPLKDFEFDKMIFEKLTGALEEYLGAKFGDTDLRDMELKDFERIAEEIGREKWGDQVDKWKDKWDAITNPGSNLPSF